MSVIQNSKSLEDTMFRSLHLFRSQGPDRVGVSLPSSEDGNTFSFRNIVFSNYLEFRIMDEVQKPSDSGWMLSCDVVTCNVVEGRRPQHSEQSLVCE
jgi:hypothetical protein